MHPIFSSNRSLLAIALLWAVVCALVAGLILQVVQPTDLPLAKTAIFFLVFPWYFLLLFVCSSNFYICLRFPLNSAQFTGLVGAQAGASIATVAIWLAIGLGWSEVLAWLKLSSASEIYHCTFTTHAILGAVFYGLWMMVHYAFLIAKEDEQNSAEALQRRLLISDIELQAVKASVHPHFMYNSLNMLANLSLIAPEKIHDICVTMSNFLRYSVNYAKKEVLTLGDELEHIKNYLVIEQERFGEHLKLSFDVDETVLDHRTIPLLLFPLVENSVKHGLGSHLNNGFINISIRRRAIPTITHRICVEISNSIDLEGVKPKSTGLGLSALRKRLNNFYQGQALLKVEHTEHTFTVTLLLPDHSREE